MASERVSLSGSSTAWMALLIFFILVIVCIGVVVGYLYLRERYIKEVFENYQEEPVLCYNDETAHLEKVFVPSKVILRRQGAFRILRGSRRENPLLIRKDDRDNQPLASSPELISAILKSKREEKTDYAPACRKYRSKSLQFQEPVVSIDITANHTDSKKGNIEKLGNTFENYFENEDSVGQTNELIRSYVNFLPAEPEVKGGANKLTYSVEELFHLQKEYDFSIPDGNNVKVSELLQSQAGLPLAEDKYNENLIDARDFLVCEQSEVRCIGLFKFVAIGAFIAPFSSSIHFQGGFCNVMTHLMSTNTMYNDCTNLPLLQTHLVELSCCFLWEQWYGGTEGEQKALRTLLRGMKNNKLREGDDFCNVQGRKTQPTSSRFHENFNESLNEDPEQAFHAELGLQRDHKVHGISEVRYELSIVYKPANEDNVPDGQEIELSILPLHDTFRLLCNLYLASPALTRAVRPYCIFKLNSLFRACSKRVPCHRHREVLPLVQASVNSTNRVSIKEFFYDIFLEILLAHLKCCISPADVFATNSPIQSLVELGIAQHEAKLQKKATQARSLVSSKFPNTRFWGHQLDFLEPRQKENAIPGEWKWSA